MMMMMMMIMMISTLYENYAHLWQYLDKFLLEWQMFQIKLVKKVKTRIFFVQ
jgi:hypothetical protein